MKLISNAVLVFYYESSVPNEWICWLALWPVWYRQYRRSSGINWSAPDWQCFLLSALLVLILITLFIWARLTPCTLQSIGVIWSVLDLNFFLLSALFSHNFAHSFHLKININTLCNAIYWRKLYWARFRIFCVSVTLPYFHLVYSCELDPQRPLNWNLLA